MWWQDEVGAGVGVMVWSHSEWSINIRGENLHNFFSDVLDCLDFLQYDFFGAVV